MARKISLLTLALLMVLGPLSSLGGAQDEVEVRIGLHAEEKNLNPFITPSALPITHDFTMLVYDTLFWSQVRLDPEPWLATGAEANDDFTTWTVSLREGVTWHDGEAFTADDVAFTFQYFSDIAGPGRYGHHVYDHPQFTTANVIDDLTVELSFAEPVPTFELLPGGDVPILPQHIWDGIEDPRADATSLPVGTGPFVMVDYQPGSSYTLEANEDYFFGAPTVDRLVMPIVRDAQAAFAGLQTGELDFVTRNLPAPLLEQVAGNEELAVIEGTRLQSQYLMFNTRKPILNDPIVRKAMSMAIDVDAFVQAIEGGLAEPGNDTWTHPDSPWAHPVGGHEFDVEAANTMLDDAGYALGENGVRVAPDGTPLAFTLLVNATAPPQVRSGDLVVEQLAEIGVSITSEPLDAPAIGAARRPGPDGPPTVDMFIAVFEAHAHADPDHLFFFFHTPGRGVGAVFSGYSNAEFDGLLQASLSAPIDEKVGLINQAQEIFAAEAPAVTLYYPNGRWAYRPGAYDGWIADPGHGVFTKRSFLPGYANVSAEEPPDETTTTGAETPDEDTTTTSIEVEAEADDAPSDDPADDAVAAEDSDADDDGGLSGGAIAGIAVAVIAGLGGGYAYMRRRNDASTVRD
jgi:peptide/nickel transport system substrate-binding protein